MTGPIAVALAACLAVGLAQTPLYVPISEPLTFCDTEEGRSASLWAKHTCEHLRSGLIEPECIPRRLFPIEVGADGAETPRAGPARGLVVMLHGYTACPQAHEDMAAYLQRKGWIVAMPLTVGHGRIHNDCDRAGARCDEEGRDPTEFMPTSRAGYIDWVNEMMGMVSEMKTDLVKAGRMPADAPVHAVGLSHGSGLATLAGALAPDFWDSMVLIAPFYGMSDSSLDSSFASLRDCSLNLRDCVAKFSLQLARALTSIGAPGAAAAPAVPGNQRASTTLPPAGGEQPPAPTGETTPQISALGAILSSVLWTRLNENEGAVRLLLEGGYDALQKLFRDFVTDAAEDPTNLPSALQTSLATQFMGWGARCERNRQMNRKGYCTFPVAAMFASHSFGQYAMQAAVASGVLAKRVQFVVVERDGYTRNALVFEAAQGTSKFADELGNPEVSACMLRVTPGCTPSGQHSNECGVPHAMVSRLDNIAWPPGSAYWLDSVHEQLDMYLGKEIEAFGVPRNEWSAESGPSVCQQQPVFAPDVQLVATPFTGLFITMEMASIEVSPKFRNEFVRWVAKKANSPLLYTISLLGVEPISRKQSVAVLEVPQSVATGFIKFYNEATAAGDSPEAAGGRHVHFGWRKVSAVDTSASPTRLRPGSPPRKEEDEGRSIHATPTTPPPDRGDGKTREKPHTPAITGGDVAYLLGATLLVSLLVSVYLFRDRRLLKKASQRRELLGMMPEDSVTLSRRPSSANIELGEALEG